MDAAGDLFIVNTHDLVEVTANSGGSQNVLYSGLSDGTTVAVDGAGNLFVSDMGNMQVLKITPSGSASVVASDVCAWGVAVDGMGNVYIPDLCHSHVLEVLAASGTQLSLGSGLNAPWGVALDSSGNLFVADNGNARLVKIPTNGGSQTTVASGLPDPLAVAVDAAGNLFITVNDGVEEVPAAGGSPVTLDTASYPSGVALDGAGDLFIADTNHNQVLELQRSQPGAEFPRDSGKPSLQPAVDHGGECGQSAIECPRMRVQHGAKLRADSRLRHAPGLHQHLLAGAGHKLQPEHQLRSHPYGSDPRHR